MWWRDANGDALDAFDEGSAAKNAMIAEKLMGLQTIVVGSMAVALFFYAL